MDNLLQKEYIEYLNSLRPHVTQCNNVSISCIKSDVIDDAYFDIQDKKPSIKQPFGTGSATYNNSNSKIIAVIDYENFLDRQTDDIIKKLELKKCDFIVYHLDGNTFFIVNELSQSSLSKNKLSDARQQLHNAVLHFSRTPAIKSFTDKFTDKLCVFSNKAKMIKTPDDMAEAFDIIRKHLPEPIAHDYKPITKLNFKFIETAYSGCIINISFYTHF
ncbi:MAG: hypothetical protein LBI60_06780 [Bacteroidales bacterium]|jgi:hypothetical protein|nr:hypothetical protein [Bacteroidales bacterium]